VSKEELLLHRKEATVVIGAKYGARNIAHDAPGCIGCALPRRYAGLTCLGHLRISFKFSIGSPYLKYV